MASQLDQTSLVPHDSRPNKKTASNETTYLPEDVIEKILTFLPFKKLCNLSILSKGYRNSWKSCRDLSFDRYFARNLTRDECRSIVENFFNNHSDDTVADRFKLHYDATDDHDIVSFWVGKAVRLGIKELELDLAQTDDKVTLDYDLIDAGNLETLKLANCELNLPMGCNGLRHLKEITLQNAMATPMLTDAIFSNCVGLRALRLMRCTLIYTIKPISVLLRTLVVKDCADVHYIEVNCPSLRKFHYHGKIMELRFQCAMQGLTDVVLEVAPPRGFMRFPNRNELLERLASVETLSVTSIFLEGLCARFENNEYRNMDFFLRKLREFHMVVEPESFLNPSDVAVFTQKCPRIHKLFIDLGRDAFGSSLIWDEFGREYLNSSQTQRIFPHLQYVKIKGFAMREPPILLARFFLKNAVHMHRLMLVKARLHYFPINYNAENLRWGIISNARIDMYEHRADTSAVFMAEFRNFGV